MKTALLYFKIKPPQKETHQLKVVEFEVSVHKTRSIAEVWSYHKYKLACRIEGHEIPGFFNLVNFGCYFEFCLFTEFKEGVTYDSMRSNFHVKRWVWKMYDAARTWDKHKDVSIELAKQLPALVLPKGYEIAKDGVVDETYSLFFQSTMSMGSSFIKHHATPYIGRKIEDVSKIQRIGIDDKIIEYRDKVFARPIKAK